MKWAVLGLIAILYLIVSIVWPQVIEAIAGAFEWIAINIAHNINPAIGK